MLKDAILRQIFGLSKERYSTPALTLESLTNISGVGRVYKMPGDISMGEIESKFELRAPDSPLMRGLSKLRFQWDMAQLDVAPLGFSSDEAYKKLVEKLCDLNPELNSIQFNRGSKLECQIFCIGVTSGFNPSDIQYYFDEGDISESDRKKNRISGYIGQLDHRLDSLSGMDGTIQHVPSPETAALINAALDQKYGPDPVVTMSEEDRVALLTKANTQKYQTPVQSFFHRAMDFVMR